MKRKAKCHEGYKKYMKRLYCKRENVCANKIKHISRRKAKLKKPNSKAKKRCKSKTTPLRSKKLRGSSTYTIYCIANCGFLKSTGNLSISIARALLRLYNNADQDRTKSKILYKWECSGEKLNILKGINHKHLIFLEDNLQYAAVDMFMLYKVWGKHEVALVLAVLGSKEKLEKLLENLSHLH
ncbi:PREDICTED: uncharacterized protein LOC105362234 [Ceratosolen solmsi marchali]|uniref:Uncharacterized protein LOC105362234 n=1 Tax=Ceratosolen solmsi marchali TaxID=326594 RepID=A0AAJ6YH00_9HYME|nr:PREDICTED: uncharacterized protein LOC105362234 [Ceratosolen solmsi marchali]